MSILETVLNLDPKVAAGFKLAKGLVEAGLEIFDILKGKDKLTDEELQAIIDRENIAQKTVREELQKLIG